MMSHMVVKDDGKAEIARRIREAGKRARAEAELRRKAGEELPKLAREIRGPSNPEPTRYGDWENKGIASDF